MPQSWDMVQILSLPFRRKACGGLFRYPKNPTSAGFEPANSGTEVSMLTTRPPKPSTQDITRINSPSLHYNSFSSFLSLVNGQLTIYNLRYWHRRKMKNDHAPATLLPSRSSRLKFIWRHGKSQTGKYISWIPVTPPCDHFSISTTPGNIFCAKSSHDARWPRGFKHLPSCTSPKLGWWVRFSYPRSHTQCLQKWYRR
jgi:hypothetical protein